MRGMIRLSVKLKQAVTYKISGLKKHSFCSIQDCCLAGESLLNSKKQPAAINIAQIEMSETAKRGNVLTDWFEGS